MHQGKKAQKPEISVKRWKKQANVFFSPKGKQVNGGEDGWPVTRE